MRSYIVVAVVAFGAHIAAAEPRNRCPLRESPRIDDLGTIPDADSALRPSEIYVAGRTAGVVQASSPTTWAMATDVQGRFSRGDYSLVGGFTLASFRLRPPIDQVNWDGAWGNIHLGIGRRFFRWSEPEPVEHTYRRSYAVRATADLDPGTAGHNGATEHALGTVFVMDGSRNRPGHHVTAVAEVHWEMVGCYAPFLHIQGGLGTSFGHDAVVEKDMPETDWERAKTTFIIPIAIAAGVHRDVSGLGSDWAVTIYAEYSVLVGRVATIATTMSDPSHALAITPTTPFGVQSRVRIGAELGTTLRFGAAFDLQIGPVDGVFGSLSVSYR